MSDEDSYSNYGLDQDNYDYPAENELEYGGDNDYLRDQDDFPTNLQDRIDKLEEDLRLAGQIGQMLMKQNEEAQGRIKEVEESQEKEREMHNGSLSNFDFERAEFERNDRRLRIELAEAREALENSQAGLDEGMTRIQELESDKIVQQIKNEERSANRTGSQVPHHLQDSQYISADELSQQIQELKIAAAKQLVEMEKQKKSQDAFIKDLRKRIDQYDEKLKDAVVLREQSQKMIEDLQKDLAEREADREALEQENIDLTTKVDEMTVSVMMYQSRYDEVNRLYNEKNTPHNHRDHDGYSSEASGTTTPDNLKVQIPAAIKAPSASRLTSLTSLFSELSPLAKPETSERPKKSHRKKKPKTSKHKPSSNSNSHVHLTSNSENAKEDKRQELSNSGPVPGPPNSTTPAAGPTTSSTHSSSVPAGPAASVAASTGNASSTTSAPGSPQQNGGDSKIANSKRKKKSGKHKQRSGNVNASNARVGVAVETDPRVTVFESNAAKEFFLLTFLAAKLNYTTHPRIKQETWPLPHINSRELYETACKEGVPFHKYNAWVFQELLDRAKRFKEARERKQKRQQVRQEEEKRYAELLAQASSQTPMALYTEEALNSFKQSEQKVKVAKIRRKKHKQHSSSSSVTSPSDQKKKHKHKKSKHRIKTNSVALTEYVHEVQDETE